MSWLFGRAPSGNSLESFRGRPVIYVSRDPDNLDEPVLTDGRRVLYGWTEVWENDPEYAIEGLIRSGAQVDGSLRAYQIGD